MPLFFFVERRVKREKELGLILVDLGLPTCCLCSLASFNLILVYAAEHSALYSICIDVYNMYIYILYTYSRGETARERMNFAPYSTLFLFLQIHLFFFSLFFSPISFALYSLLKANLGRRRECHTLYVCMNDTARKKKIKKK